MEIYRLIIEMLISEDPPTRVCEVDDVSSALTLNFQVLLAKYARSMEFLSHCLETLRFKVLAG